MRSFRVPSINLLGWCLIFAGDHSGCCLSPVWQPPAPSISHLRADSDTQSLVVSWLVNRTGLVGDVNEIQISRTDNHTLIYTKNVSASPADSREHTWTWTSDLPLECADHSVRMRRFYNQSAPSPWSQWVTNYGAEAKEKTKYFPLQRVLRQGSSATICCVPPPGVNITSIIFNNSKYPLKSIGSRVQAITVDNLAIPTTIIKILPFKCEDTTGQTNFFFNYVCFPPQKPRNLSCVTSHMTTVTCTWDPGRAPHWRNSQTHTLHIENSDQAPVSCGPRSCTFPAIPGLLEYNVRLVVKNRLGEETESYSFNTDRERERVSPGMTDATVSWIVRGNLTRLSLPCQVALEQGRTKELTCSSVGGLCKVKLEHLLPDTRYSTAVRCSVNGRLWGEWTRPITFTTYPFVTLNLWRRIKQMPDHHGREVTLLWKLHAPGSATAVAVRHYTVQWSQEGQNRSEKVVGQTQTEVSIGPGQCNFTVLVVLHTGPSFPAHITIPRSDDGEKLPVEKRLSTSPAGGFSLSWAERDAATCGYTVEWCTLGIAEYCPLQWIKTLQGNNTLVLPAGHFKAGCRYTFNIYECTEHGDRLLEMQTGYSQELEAVQHPSLVEHVQITSSSVTLEWTYNEDDPAHLGFITGYLVTVQDGGPNELPGHGAGSFTVSVADPRRKSVSIEGLTPSHEYVFSVSALTKEGPGKPASITIRTKINYPALLAKILTPILLLLGCTILLWPQRQKLKRGFQGVFAYPAGMNIKIAELEGFLHETADRVQRHRVEECVSCDIEIVASFPPPDETATPRDAEPPSAPPSPASHSSASSSSPSCAPPHDYRPQLATPPCEAPAPQPVMCITNKTYFHCMVADFSEPQGVTSREVKLSFEPSECLQESCSVK